MYAENKQMEDLLGEVFISVTSSSDDITFTKADGSYYKLEHYQNCCESVYVEDITGDLSDLENTTILFSEESSEDDPEASESGTWTFYKLGTIKGYVDIRFYGSSNGYYSESVDLVYYKAQT